MKYITAAFLVLIFASCASDATNTKTIDYEVENEKEILAFIADNNLVAEKSSTGLYYVIDVEGYGEQPTATSNVTVAYKGYFTNNSVFDESATEGISFNLNQVIAGWTEGIPLFKEGGNGMLLVPSNLAYGDSGRSGIPGGSVLIFDVQLISVN